MRLETSNKPDAVNPAMALGFAIEDQWRRVTDLGRSADSHHAAIPFYKFVQNIKLCHDYHH